MLLEQRAEIRLSDTILPQRLNKIMVTAGSTILGCQVMDASKHGLGFVVDKAYNGEVTMGQNIKIGFETVEVEAKVVNLYEKLAPDSFRFGVQLSNNHHLPAYHRLLSSGRP